MTTEKKLYYEALYERACKKWDDNDKPIYEALKTVMSYEKYENEVSGLTDWMLQAYLMGEKTRGQKI